MDLSSGSASQKPTNQAHTPDNRQLLTKHKFLVSWGNTDGFVSFSTGISKVCSLIIIVYNMWNKMFFAPWRPGKEWQLWGTACDLASTGHVC